MLIRSIILLLLFPSLLFARTSYLCNYVIDGDTIIITIKDKREKVRLIGVDTPEIKTPDRSAQYFANEAKEFTKKLVEDKNVRLEYDLEKRDKYGRILAYVYLEDGTFLNAELIRKGYGFAYKKYPFKYLDEFSQLEKEAKKERKGLWRRGRLLIP